MLKVRYGIGACSPPGCVTGDEDRPIRFIANVLTGGQHQYAASDMAVELATAHGACITALTPEDPFDPTLHHAGSMLLDPNRGERHRSYRSALDNFEDQIQAIKAPAYRTAAPSEDASLYSTLAATISPLWPLNLASTDRRSFDPASWLL
jgi:hypothetical protein